MNSIELTKCYVRHRDNYPETVCQDYARRGFWELGIEVVPFEGFGDIEEIKDFGPTVGISGYIGDVHAALTKLGKPIPSNFDYPDELKTWWNRNIWKSTLDEVRASTNRFFVKPIEQKAFTGFVWENDATSRKRIVTCDDFTEVWCSDVLDFRAEYRVFVLDGKVLDARLYKGKWNMVPNSWNPVEVMIYYFKSAPRAYCLDVGVIENGSIALVEVNDGFAFGPYGLLPTLYARMLSARWSEMTK